MTEVLCRTHFRNVFRYQIGCAAVTIAGEDQCVAADAIARTIRSSDFKTSHGAVAVGKERVDRCVADDGNRGLLGRAMQSVNQFGAGAAWEAGHGARGMTGIIEVGHEADWNPVPVGEPLDRCSGVLCDESGDRRASFVMSFSPD